jgi:hypothetical protein
MSRRCAGVELVQFNRRAGRRMRAISAACATEPSRARRAPAGPAEGAARIAFCRRCIFGVAPDLPALGTIRPV